LHSWVVWEMVGRRGFSVVGGRFSRKVDGGFWVDWKGVSMEMSWGREACRSLGSVEVQVWTCRFQSRFDFVDRATAHQVSE
jgi:hypothetical protein